MKGRDSESGLRDRIAEMGERAGAGAVAVAVFDYERAAQFSHEGERWFHAASCVPGNAQRTGRGGRM
jgi:hypothetical protein